MAKSGFTVIVQKDNSEAVLRQMADNIPLALDAMGIKAVNLIVSQMQSGYGKPIRQTGDLQRSITYKAGENDVVVGTNIEYALFVHDGTRKMKGRPYIRDALYSREQAEKVFGAAIPYLKKGFK